MGCVSSKRDAFMDEISQDLDALRSVMNQLKNVYGDVKKTVEYEEKFHKKRADVVDDWLSSVETMEEEVKEILAKAEEEIQKRSPTSYEVGKILPQKTYAVTELLSRADNFDEVAVPLPPSPPSPVIETPLDKTVGLDLLFEEALRSLQEDEVRIIGICGMGGVGKTTLMKSINHELSKTNYGFDAVTWVVVSKPANVGNVQELILNQFGIPDDKWKDGNEAERAAVIFNVLKTKKFVLFLDDIWEKLELSELGIPPLNDENMSKVVFTTRNLNVCEGMGADMIFKVKCLEFNEAFALFQDRVGEDTMISHPDIPELAKIVVLECKGLPLALITTGRAMREKKTPQEWNEKLLLLKSYPSKFPGMENNLFPVLAFSYDNLCKDDIKSCFLYCSTFPEDYDISYEHLIKLWIGEGFLGECNNIQDARTQGEDIIEKLKLACMLENGESQKHVKMHDVIRDMALWLACENGKKKNRIVVKEHGRLIKGKEIAEWEEAQRISLWDNRIEEFTGTPNFLNLETLFASGESMKSLPRGFFINMPVIRVLDLSNSELTQIPEEIGELHTLQYLNLSQTEIQKLPMELKNLKQLRCLILDEMDELKIIPPQTLSSLSSLQLFSIYAPIGCNGDWGPLLEELDCLEKITEISIPLREVIHVQKFVRSSKLGRSIKRLSLQDYTGMGSLEVSPYLQILQIWRCFDLKYLKINLEKGGSLATFFSLSELEIIRCPKLLNLTCLTYAPNLRSLGVEYCESMKEVIGDEENEISGIEAGLDVFFKLSTLRLCYLPKLRSIYGPALSFPSLREITVKQCGMLRKLPLDSKSNFLQKIEGEEDWWDRLEWEDQTVKHNLSQYFVPK